MRQSTETYPQNTPPVTSSLDYYKLTMGNVIHEHHPETEVTFTLKNRNLARPLSQYVSPDELQADLDAVREQGFTNEEAAYLAGLKAQNGEVRFTEDYLSHIVDTPLPPVTIATDPTTGELAVSATGPWVDVSLWETVVMSKLNERYYDNFLKSHNLTLNDIYAEGDRRLTEKITQLREHPDILFSDFGTRRRFSLDWHEHVIDRLTQALPNQFVGTSNPWFAYKYDLAPIGTSAHEMPMVYAALEDARTGQPLEGHARMLDDWQAHYKSDLSIALTDTFGSDFFFTDFGPEQAMSWSGLRHDSGDPVVFGEKAIAFYETHGIDPAEKTIVFSDGLNVEKIIALNEHFDGRIKLLFGWGTDLMNDLGLPANNFVMKATAANGTPTVKLSDDPGKHTGPTDYVERYQAAAQPSVLSAQ